MKTFKHGGGGGDMLYGLATMKHLSGGVLHLNFDGGRKFYYDLLMSQPYIKEIVHHMVRPNEKWINFPVDYNLDKFRGQPFNGGYTLLECHMMAMKIKFDITKRWLNVKPKYVSDIVINDTGKIRWEGITVDWSCVKGFEDRCIFIGLKGEYKNFIRDRGYNVRYYEIKDANEFAQIIKGSKLYLGNQSTGLAIAEGLKHPRVADLYIGKSKQYPKGENGYYKLSKELIRRYLNE